MRTYHEVIIEACKLFTRTCWECEDLIIYFLEDKNLSEDDLLGTASLFNTLVCQYLAYLLSMTDYDLDDIDDYLCIEKEKIGVPTDIKCLFSGKNDEYNFLQFLEEEGFIELTDDFSDIEGETLTYKIPLLAFKSLNDLKKRIHENREEGLHTECKEHRPCRVETDPSIKK